MSVDALYQNYSLLDSLFGPHHDIETALSAFNGSLTWRL